MSREVKNQTFYGWHYAVLLLLNSERKKNIPSITVTVVLVIAFTLVEFEKVSWFCSLSLVLLAKEQMLSNANCMMIRWLYQKLLIFFHKTEVLVYKCLHGMAPQYLQMYWADVNSHQPASSIRSLQQIDCSMHLNKVRRPQLCCLRTFKCGTVSLLNCVHQTSRWRCSETDLRHSCSTCNCNPVHVQPSGLVLYKYT